MFMILILVLMGCGFWTVMMPALPSFYHRPQILLDDTTAVSDVSGTIASSLSTVRNLRRAIQSPLSQPRSISATALSLEREILQFIEDSDTLQPTNEQASKRKSPVLSSMLQELQDSWDHPLVHIVNTRFMQEQGHLKALGRARLYLFQTFCLPSMVQQSTQQFLWIIKTDPQLDPTLLRELIATVEPYPNIYLVASNKNFMIRDTHAPPGTGHSWRDGAEIRDLLLPTTARIYTGNRTQLYAAMVQKDQQIVLETRLDADDGLHKFYLKQIQEKALEQFLPLEEDDDDEGNGEEGQGVNKNIEHFTPPKWLYWCTRRHVEWHGGVQEREAAPLLTTSNTGTTEDYTVAPTKAKSVDYYGSLLAVEHSNLCITPGITVGFGIGTSSDQVPIHAHDKLFKAIHDLKPENSCGYEKASDCLELVEDFLLVAVRARTPTSAGMQRVGAEVDDDGGKSSKTSTEYHKKHHKKKPQVSYLRTYLFWDMLHDDFSILREQIRHTNQFILNHLVPIAKDNLEGQCTSDHSCKVG